MDKNLDAIVADLKKSLSQEEQGYLSQESEEALNDMVINAVEKETPIERKINTIDRIDMTIKAYENFAIKVNNSNLDIRQKLRVCSDILKKVKELNNSKTLIENLYTKAQKRASKMNPYHEATIIRLENNENLEPVI